MSFNFNINLNGVAAAGGSLKLEEGYYNATVSECYVDPARNEHRVLFKLAITDAPYTGVIRTTGLNKPKSAEDKVRYYWRAALESCGYTPAQLDTPNGLAISDQLFVGRPCTIYFKPKNENSMGGDDRYDKLTFLSPNDWALRKKVFDSQIKAPTSSNAATVPSPAAAITAAQPATTSPTNTIPQPSAGFAGNAMTTEQLMAMVGRK